MNNPFSLPDAHAASAEPVIVEHANTAEAAGPDGYFKMFHFVFLGGFTFPDIISLNFTLTVDKEEKRPAGSGIGNTNIIKELRVKNKTISFKLSY